MRRGEKMKDENDGNDGRPTAEAFVQAEAALRNAGCDTSKISPETRAIFAQYAAGEITSADVDAYMARRAIDLAVIPE
jgi:hypothetical protein